MSSSFTAFTELAESKKQPHTRTLRTSLGQKLLDTFVAVSGRFFSEPYHPGLFDYATAGIAYILGLLLLGSFELRKPILTIGAVIGAVILNAPFIVARYAVATLVTIAASPIILLVHLISSGIAKKYKNAAMNLTGDIFQSEVQSDCSLKGINIPRSLRDYLTETQLNIDDLAITLEEEPAITVPATAAAIPAKKYLLQFWRKATDTKKANTELPYSVKIKKRDLTPLEYPPYSN